MTKRKPGYVEKEDWRTWQAEGAPDPPLLTRTEVLALVERWGAHPAVDERTLRYWEKRGLSPRPSRFYHNGAVRALYPSWVADLIYIIRIKQGSGQKLADLGEVMREEALRLSLLPPRPHPFPDKPSKFEYAMQMALDGPRLDAPPFYHPPTLPDYAERAIASVLRVVVRQQWEVTGFATERITVHLADYEGSEKVYEVPIPEAMVIPRPPDFSRYWTPPPPPPWTQMSEKEESRPTDTKSG